MAESVDALVSNTSGFTSIPVRPRVWVRKGESFKLSPFLLWYIQFVFRFSGSSDSLNMRDLRCRSRLNYMVIIPVVGMTRFEAHGSKSIAKLLGGNTTKGRGIAFVHRTEHLGCSKPFSFFIGFRSAVTCMKDVFQR